MASPERGASREVMPGVTLTRSTQNGFSVITQGQYIGFLHASIGASWNAYVRPGVHLGRFEQDEAVRHIVAAARAHAA